MRRRWPADGRRFYPDDPLQADPDKLELGVDVEEHELSQDYDFLQNTLSTPGSDGPALNINTLGEVPDSSWFTNRIGTGGMTEEAVVRGANLVDGPAPGPLTVVGRPGAGITPKFLARDTRGDRYVIKLDSPGFHEMASTAEYIGTKLLYAIGFHTPENYILFMDPESLVIEEGSTWRAYTGHRREILRQDVDNWLAGQRRQPDGTIRVLASRFISARPVGPHLYYGTRSDDRNDIFAHERRRELRSPRAFSAWVNHDDTRSLNSFTGIAEENGSRFLRHYLIDFGSTLGSGSVFAQEARAGYEHYVELNKIFRRIVGLGLLTDDWEHVDYPEYPGVGRFEAGFYEPWRWKPQYSNPAFDRMDAADAFWAAQIMSRFTSRMIERIVSDARMSEPATAAYVVDTLITRLHKTVDYWLTRTNPLDEFRVELPAEEGALPTLRFENAAERSGAARGSASESSEYPAYSVRWWSLDNLADRETQPLPIAGVTAGLGQTVSGVSAATHRRSARAGSSASAPGSRSYEIDVPENVWGSHDDVGDRYAIVEIGIDHPEYPHWSEPVRVGLRLRSGDVGVVGIDRPTMSPRFALSPPDQTRG